MSDWDFVTPEDETHVSVSSQSKLVVEMRPNRMGLGASREDIQQKISDNAKRARLVKLLGRREHDEDDLIGTHSHGPADSDSEFSKSHVQKTVAHRIPVQSNASNEPKEALNKNQRKRMKRKQKLLQKQIIASDTRTMENQDANESEVQETRDIRSPRSRFPHARERTRKSSSHSESSNRSCSPLDRSGSGQRTSSVETEGNIRSTRFSKSSGTKLNTWDVPEFLPGALPRANPEQRAFFEQRSKKVFQNNRIMDEIEAEESRERKETEQAYQVENHFRNLKELFPMLDDSLIQETYILMDGNLDQAISQLLLISESLSGTNSTEVIGRGPPSSDDEKEFPALKRDRPGESFEITMVETEDVYYKDKLLGGPDPR